MNATELMIGDIVSVSGKPMHVTFAMMHAGIEVKPIPLTPEILEKNGWELTKTASSKHYWHDDVPFHIPIEPYHHWRGDEDRIFADDFFDSVFIRLGYVHELQHALKLCGIEKEVVV